LEKDPTHRYRSVSDLISAVDSTAGRKQASPETIGKVIKRKIGQQHHSSPAETRDAAVAKSSFPLGIVAAVGIAAVVLLVGLIGIAVWALTGDANAAATNATLKNGSSAKSAPVAGGQRVHIDVDEGKAQVVRDGQIVGTTPLDLDLAPGEKPSITLRRDGFEDKTVQLEPTSGKKVFTYSLKAKN
jgi:hypothetical protein